MPDKRKKPPWGYRNDTDVKREDNSKIIRKIKSDLRKSAKGFKLPDSKSGINKLSQIIDRYKANLKIKKVNEYPRPGESKAAIEVLKKKALAFTKEFTKAKPLIRKEIGYKAGPLADVLDKLDDVSRRILLEFSDEDILFENARDDLRLIYHLHNSSHATKLKNKFPEIIEIYDRARKHVKSIIKPAEKAIKAIPDDPGGDDPDIAFRIFINELESLYESIEEKPAKVYYSEKDIEPDETGNKFIGETYKGEFVKFAFIIVSNLSFGRKYKNQSSLGSYLHGRYKLKKIDEYWAKICSNVSSWMKK